MAARGDGSRECGGGNRHQQANLSVHGQDEGRVVMRLD